MTPADNSPTTPTVHIVDDDLGLREALSNLLRSSGYNVDLHESPEAFMASENSRSPGCLLLDIKFPGISGLDFQATFLERRISLPVILMTGHADVPSTIRGMKAGALDLLTKPFDDEVLIAAVEAAIKKDTARVDEESQVSEVMSRYTTLTEREKEVMHFVVKGLMNKQVAAEIALSEITVKVHRGTMMKKLNVRTVADLVRLSEVIKGHSGD